MIRGEQTGLPLLGERVGVRVPIGFAVVVALTFCLSVPSLTATPKKAVVLKSKLSSIEQKIAKVKQKLRKTEGKRRTVLGELNFTEQKLAVAQGIVSRNKLQLLDARSDLAVTNARLARTQKQLHRRRSLLRTRVVDIYEGEDLNYANVVLGSADMWSFLTRAYYLKKILDSDTTLIGEINRYKAQIEADKARQTHRVTQIASLQADLIVRRDEVAGLADEKRDQLQAIEHDKELTQQALDEFEAESNRVQAMLQRLYSGQKSKYRYAGTFSGGLMRPCAGRISSPYGYRCHPISGIYKLHTGVDIAARTGTPIQAAADGVVMVSGYLRAYGNTVIIDHGSKVSTLYGHCSALLVRPGQSVKKGETIARVGSTGWSTGPHCHFEKRINGKAVNPM